jgi:hypothetical protein
LGLVRTKINTAVSVRGGGPGPSEFGVENSVKGKYRLFSTSLGFRVEGKYRLFSTSLGSRVEGKYRLFTDSCDVSS